MTTKKTATSKKKVGRPSLYTDELADKIVGLIEEGYSERQIGKMAGMPSAVTIWKWKEERPEFLKRSARARELSASIYREKALKIAESVNDFADEVERSHRDAVEKDANDPEYDEDGSVKKTPKLCIPPGWVEAKKLVIQELNREAALRDDSRFGDRKTVKLDATPEGAGMADVYAKMLDAMKGDDDA